MILPVFSGKIRRPRRRGKKKSAKKVPSFVTVVIVTLALLLVVILLQETLPRRVSVNERLQPSDMAALLPAGAQMSPAGWLEIVDVPQSSYLVGYVIGDGTPFAAYLKWNRASGKYAMVSSLPLTAGAVRLHGQPTFSALLLGTGAPDAVAAHASDAATDAMLVLVPRGDAYVIATKIGQDGVAGPAYFQSAKNVETVAFQDVNGDGSKDAVVTVPTTKSVSVFAWINGAFRYDKDLSWTLTTSERVFPEPVAPPATP